MSGDPYGRGYVPPRRDNRYTEYPETDEYYAQPYPPRGVPTDPPYDRSRGYDYERGPSYDPMPPRSNIPRGGEGYRAPPARIEPEYPPRRSTRSEYPPAAAPRGPPPVDSRYADPVYYPPPTGRRAPSPTRDNYGRDYPSEPPYRERDESRYAKRGRRPEEDYDMGNYGRPADYYYDEPEPPAPSRRVIPPADYPPRGAPNIYEPEIPATRESRPRRTRDQREPPPPVKATTQKTSPPKPKYSELYLAADGIRKEVLQSNITRMLGSDAVSLGPLEVDNVLVYKYSAYRHFTPEQIKDLKAESSRYDPREKHLDPRSDDIDPRSVETRGGDLSGQMYPTTSSRRRAADDREDPMMTDLIPREDYIYASNNPGIGVPPRRSEIRATTGRTQHDPTYGTSYHEPPSRHGRPIEATAMHQDDDDEMQD
ncbi:hypothetical protein H072_8483 [Dactylellina haptotyla CBS 200.50]|uniref:Uncharacterized protein n=1 Tax=Dactylellina haptotyla (strain CBS 200.50) TaxID=1284197 RepID=S8A9Z6_DACHA|nr:hypothetical protein H072_8483 [Dactylellina haptotyla CBS 200.50]